jgi:hypothetical protein
VNACLATPWLDEILFHLLPAGLTGVDTAGAVSISVALLLMVLDGSTRIFRSVADT